MSDSHRRPVPLNKAYRLLNHGPTVLVSAAHDGQRNIMAAAWAMPLDFEPPKVAVVLDKATWTRQLLEGAGTFVYTPRNTGNGEVYGIEFDASFSLSFIGLLNTTAVLDEQGRFLRTNNTLVDVSEQKAASKALADQLAEDNYDLHGVLATLPGDASETAWEDELERLAARIQRLGPINLAAIDEYQQQSERKRYLDAQNADLVEALDTLENVIRKIDKETRNRFKETFDQINGGLQALFPKVFGGGNAYLELTGEDLLDTGVTIMARPPGKKNSTIHLLSGGEKALTALALVFAIFKLNPAPFCMLDEVDAPLDDANVGRYARLVKEMSETVQFIYITHNKIAMEMADQLMGVTMHEPGCSRLVAVDVEEALALVES